MLLLEARATRETLAFVRRTFGEKGALVMGRLARAWKEWLRSFVVIILVIASFRSAVADWNDVPTGSMRPTILEGDRIVVNKLAYDLKIPFTTIRLLIWSHPRRGDIVVLLSPRDGIRLVKRVVGLPGDTIEMHNNQLSVNGEPVHYSPLSEDLATRLSTPPAGLMLEAEELGETVHPVMINPTCQSLRTFGPIAVPSGYYFVMGDNRDQSLDSRHFGVVRRSSIVGRATAVAASVDPERKFLPRWNRFFTGLH
jgi:signal peptidase I